MSQRIPNDLPACRGFTLIEIALVMIIVGLILGGVLRGQELQKTARVRTLISQQDGLTAAYLGFVDRYRHPPGDYMQASAHISGVAAGANGNGDGLIKSMASGSAIDEHIAVWDHLSKANFIIGTYSYAPGNEGPGTAPTNPLGRYYRLIFDNDFGAGGGRARHNLKTGSMIPSDILAEIDRKTDDGNPVGGVFQFSAYAAGGIPPALANCSVTSGSVVSWAIQSIENCGAARLY